MSVVSFDSFLKFYPVHHGFATCNRLSHKWFAHKTECTVSNVEIVSKSVTLDSIDSDEKRGKRLHVGWDADATDMSEVEFDTTLFVSHSMPADFCGDASTFSSVIPFHSYGYDNDHDSDRPNIIAQVCLRSLQGA